jgi:hypothetical protein
MLTSKDVFAQSRLSISRWSPLTLAFWVRVVVKSEIGWQGKMTPRARSALVRERTPQPRARAKLGLASCTSSITLFGPDYIDNETENRQHKHFYTSHIYNLKLSLKIY